MGNLKLTSSAFSDGGEIPRECGYKNGNEIPPLAINGIPKGTKSLTLIMDDPDAMGAVGKVWVHWVKWNINTTVAGYQ
ncbi:MAG: YbhB/YbcL family Raf kinase inhibitor-like protein, partial [Thermoproteota archaeon]|nr:YbhB/YbcL family Raf kinase inhibitor-like protein [Thermoproteota archaeon]